MKDFFFSILLLLSVHSAIYCTIHPFRYHFLLRTVATITLVIVIIATITITLVVSVKVISIPALIHSSIYKLQQTLKSN